MPLKTNLVTKKATELTKALASNSDVTMDLFLKAAGGDASAAQVLGTLGQEGRIASEFAPMAAQNIIDTLQGTQAIAEAQRDILLQAGQTHTAISGARIAIGLAEQKLKNTSAEQIQGYIISQRVERENHKYRMGMVAMRAYIDNHLNQAGQKQAALAQDKRLPMQAQLADIDYEKAQAKEWLSSGQKVKVDGLVRKSINPWAGKLSFDRIKMALGW